MTVRIIQGDCRDVLATLPDESVHCVVTSPPYFGLRDYQCEGQIGLEPSPDAYVAELVAAFRELRRVLREDGTVWLNIADSYAAQGGAGSGGNFARINRAFQQRNVRPNGKSNGLKPKDLCMIPARVALVLQADGWYVRSEIIWQKPNPMPESVRDRPTNAHEKVFMLTRSPRYFYDADAVAEPAAYADCGRPSKKKGEFNDNGEPLPGRLAFRAITEKRNLRNVWTITPQPFRGEHFAIMPPELAARCIKAGTSEKGVCPHCGAPWERVTERRDSGWDGSRYGKRVVAAAGGAKSGGTARSTLGSSNGKLVGRVETVGWHPSCACPEHKPVPAVVLDCFGGAGTTGLVADRLGRDAILIELNPEYAEMARRRLADDRGPLLDAILASTAENIATECAKSAAPSCDGSSETKESLGRGSVTRTRDPLLPNKRGD